MRRFSIVSAHDEAPAPDQTNKKQAEY